MMMHSPLSLLRSRWVFSALVGSVLFPTGAARAEGLAQPTLTVGSKVRLRAPATGKVQGIVIETEEAFLHVRTDDGPVEVRRDEITRIEIGAGRRRRTVKGLAIGAAMGGVSAAFGSCCTPGGSTSGSDQAAAIGAGLAAGVAIGAAVGFFVKSERWTSLPVERVRVGVAPSGKGGVSLSFALRF
jgi:hypothetical protein